MLLYYRPSYYYDQCACVEMYTQKGGAHHFPLVGAPSCLHFGVGSTADGLSQSVVQFLGSSDTALKGVAMTSNGCDLAVLLTERHLGESSAK